MDPVSQGIVGAVFPQSIANKKDLAKATLIGFVSGLAADLDVLIRSDKDPLLFIDYHRQFTHSLLFIPVGGFIMAVIFWLIFKKKLKFQKIFLFSTLGYATHCLLDACTTYGTELLWPFSNAKIAWNNIAVIDPVFTIVLVFLVIIALIKRSSLIARIGVFFCIAYLLFGVHQRDAAEKYLLNIAALRGHTPEKVLVHPTLGNVFLWRGIYLNDGNYFVDGIRVSPVSDPVLYEGSSVKMFDLNEQLPDLNRDSVLYKDIKRFEHFTSGYLINVSENGIGDFRYSALPNSTDPLWAIEFDPQKPENHIMYISSVGGSRDKLQTFWNMILGKDISKDG